VQYAEGGGGSKGTIKIMQQTKRQGTVKYHCISNAGVRRVDDM
jgi:hypothetical protein